jgi:hypothetical protein
MYCGKGAADWFLLLILVTPSELVMRPLWDSEGSAGFDFTSLKQKDVYHSRIRRIGRLADRLDAFTAIKSPGMRCQWSLFLRPSSKTSPGMVTWDFLAAT